MPDPLPLYPSEENLKTAKEYLNVQASLNAILLKEAKLGEEIGHINIDLEDRAKRRLSYQRDMNEAIKKDISNLQKEIQETVTLEGVARKDAERRIEAIEQRIRDTKQLRDLAEMYNQIEISQSQKEYEHRNRIFALLESINQSTLKFQVQEFSLTKSIGDQLIKSNVAKAEGAYFIGAIVTMLKGGYELFKKFDTAAWEFRKAMGFTREEARDIRMSTERLAIDFTHIGITVEGAYSAVLGLREQMGSVFTVTSDLVKTTAILKAQLGVSEDATAGFLRNMAAVSKSTMQSQEDIAFMTADLAKAAGVPLNMVMSDIQKASSTTLVMMSRVPNQILRTAIEARRLNVSLNEMARSSRQILDFSDNINAEMDASVLLGHSINLQRARELAYRRDLEGSTKEILRITKQIDFENLDVFQQEAFARATGKSVDELLRMVQAERQLDRARRDPELRGRVEAYEKLRRANEETAKVSAKNLEIQLMQRSNQERLTAISQKWSQIMMKAQEALLPIVDVILSVVNGFLSLVPLTMAFSKPIFGVFKAVGGILGFVGKIGLAFGKWIPIVGWVITAFQFISSLFRRLHGIGEAFKEGILHGILFGLEAILGAIYDTLLKPFVDVWNWIKGIFVGKSPSTLALGILKGIVSIQAMLFDALTSPFRNALAWIVDKIPGMGKFAGKIRGGAGGIFGEPMEKRAINAYVPAVNITPEGAKGGGPAAPPAETPTVAVEKTGKYTLDDVYSVLKQLNDNLLSGKIQAPVYLDSQLLSNTIARQTEFRRGFGVNVV